MMMLGLARTRNLDRYYQAFTGNGTFTTPVGVSRVEVTTVGGGAGGAGSTNYGSGGAGGGGGFVTTWNTLAVNPASSYSVTVGNGGFPGRGDGGTPGYPGGASSFSNLQSSPGGTSSSGSGVVDLGEECATYTGYRYVSGSGGGYYSPPASRRGQGGNGGPDRTSNSYLTQYGSGGVAGLVVVRWDA